MPQTPQRSTNATAADFIRALNTAAETARTDRPEYGEHQALIDEYKKP